MHDFFYTLSSKISAALIAILAFLGINGTVEEPPPSKFSGAIVDISIDYPLEEFEEEKHTLKPIEATAPQQTVPSIQETKQLPSPPAPNLAPSEETLDTIVAAPITPSVLNEIVRQSVINIFCLSKGGGFFQPASGSGVFIDERGVILTNAHVAQYFLLRDYPTSDYMSCVIRAGSPATPIYRAELLFIPEQWIKTNAQNLNLATPRGTGEHDYALLRITELINKEKPAPPSVALTPDISSENAEKDKDVLVASYPAGFIDNFSITKSLWMTSSFSKISDIYSFRNGTPDIISLHNLIGAQEGSSGGAVVDFLSGKLLGIIVTRTNGETTAERELRALTISHINKSLLAHTGETLAEFLSGDLKEKAFLFNATKARKLTEILIDELEK